MLKQERVDFCISTLQKLYPEIPIPLDHKDPYTLLVAVLLSAQSTDVRVNQITPLLFEQADNPYDMVRLSVDQIREIWARVAEDFRPFDVNVTTINPGTFNDRQAAQVIIGGDGAFLGGNIGYTAPQGAFSDPLLPNLSLA